MLVRVLDVFVLPNGKAFSVQSMGLNDGVDWISLVEVEPNDHSRFVGSSDHMKVNRSEFNSLFAKAKKVNS